MNAGTYKVGMSGSRIPRSIQTCFQRHTRVAVFHFPVVGDFLTEYFSFFNFAEEQELATLKQGLRLDQDEIGDSFDTCYALYDTFCLSLLEAVVDLAYEHFFIYWVGARCEVVPSPAGSRFLPFPLACAVSVQSARKASTRCSAKAPRRARRYRHH